MNKKFLSVVLSASMVLSPMGGRSCFAKATITLYGREFSLDCKANPDDCEGIIRDFAAIKQDYEKELQYYGIQNTNYKKDIQFLGDVIQNYEENKQVISEELQNCKKQNYEENKQVINEELQNCKKQTRTYKRMLITLMIYSSLMAAFFYRTMKQRNC